MIFCNCVSNYAKIANKIAIESKVDEFDWLSSEYLWELFNFTVDLLAIALL
jgi:hypothetical protein